MVWHHRLNGHEFEQTLGDSEGQGSLTCCMSMGWQRAGHEWVAEWGDIYCGKPNYQNLLKKTDNLNSFMSITALKVNTKPMASLGNYNVYIYGKIVPIL